MNKILFTSLVAGFVCIFLVAKIECSKFTPEELAELRRFYYDDDDTYDENPTPSSEDSSGNKNSRKNQRTSPKTPEPRSSSKSKKGTEKPASEESEEPSFGPGAFFNDARKFLNASRKTINEAATRILPPLPKIRMIRRAKSKSERDDYETADTIEEQDEEDIEERSGSADKKKNNRGVLFQNPFKNFSNDASRIAADTGGKILSILNKLTPPPALGLPTPLPNLEDFGG